MQFSILGRFARRWLAFSVAFLLLVSVTTAQQAAAPPPRPAQTNVAATSPIASRTLPNGLTILVFEDHTVPLVTVEYAVRAGSMVESPDRNGLSHLYEHMFFKSNRATQAQEDYLKNIGQLGISYNGSTKEEISEAYFTAASTYFPIALRYMRDAIRFPAFDPKELAVEEQVVLGELDRNDSNPYGSLSREVNNRLFFQYPGRKDPSGNRETVRTATPEKMRAMQADYWVPNNSAVVVSGDVAPDAAFRAVEALFGDWPRSPDPFVRNPLVEHPPLTKSSGAVLVRGVQVAVVELGWQGPSVGKDTPATYAADVFSFILRQPNSRFQRNLVDSGLVTSVDISYYTQRNMGPITLIFEASPQKMRAALRAVHNEIAHFADPDYFTDQELENAKVYVAANELYSREKPSDYVHEIAFWWATTGIDYLNAYVRQVAGTARADILRYLRTYILGKPHVGVALLPQEAQSLELKPEEVIGPW
jgi:zinc protease